MPFISRLRSTAPVVCFWAYAAFLAAATHAPADEVSFLVRAVDSGVVEPDKLIHVAAYAVLGLLAAVAYGGRWHGPLRAAWPLLLLLAVAAGADEATQPLFGRVADSSDWLADVAGSGIGLAVGLGCLGRAAAAGRGPRADGDAA